MMSAFALVFVLASATDLAQEEVVGVVVDLLIH
jgi:hypothetical protein